MSKPSYTGTIEYFRQGRDWRFRIRAINGKIVGPTESFVGGPAKVRRAYLAMRRALVKPRIVWLD